MKKCIPILFVLIAACQKPCPDDLSTCVFSQKPDSVYINLDLTINDENPSVLYEIFKNRYEGNNENRVFVGETFNRETSVLLPPGYYTAKAIYNRDNDTVWVFNRGQSKVISYDCDFACYDIKEAKINARLR